MTDNASIVKLEALFKELEETSRHDENGSRQLYLIAQEIHETVSQSADSSLKQFFIETLRTDFHPSVKAAVIESLGKMRDPIAVDALIAVLKNLDNDEEIRSEAAKALGRIGDVSVVPTLIEMMRDKQNGILVMWHCADALGLIRDAAAIDSLIDALVDDYSYERKETSDITDAAMDALIAIGGEYTVKRLLEKLTQDQLSAYDDADIKIRQDIIYALGKLKNPLGIEALLSILDTPNEDDELQCSAIDALAHFDDPRIMPAIQAALKSEYEHVRQAANRALEKLTSEGD